MTEWFSDGATAQVSTSDRGIQYGDGLFETIAIRKGELRLWDFHIDRLARGCGLLSISQPAATGLYDGVKHAIRQSGVPSSYSVAKIVVSAGAGRRGYGRKVVETPSVMIAAFPSAPLPVEHYRDGVDTVLCKTRLAGNSPLAGLKTLNRLEQVLARSEFVETDVFEGLTMDADDNIICGTMSNVFVVNDGKIVTPSLDSCGVEGVMRRHTIETLNELGIETKIRAVKRDEMDSMDEVFICNSQFGVMPVRRCMEMEWAVGDTTRTVMGALAERGIGECRL